MSQLHTWRKSHRYPLNKRLGGPQSQSRQFSEEVSLLSQLGTEPQFLSRPVDSLVSTPTTQSQHLKKKNLVWIMCQRLKNVQINGLTEFRALYNTDRKAEWQQADLRSYSDSFLATDKLPSILAHLIFQEKTFSCEATTRPKCNYTRPTSI